MFVALLRMGSLYGCNPPLTRGRFCDFGVFFYRLFTKETILMRQCDDLCAGQRAMRCKQRAGFCARMTDECKRAVSHRRRRDARKKLPPPEGRWCSLLTKGFSPPEGEENKSANSSDRGNHRISSMGLCQQKSCLPRRGDSGYRISGAAAAYLPTLESASSTAAMMPLLL